LSRYDSKNCGLLSWEAGLGTPGSVICNGVRRSSGIPARSAHCSSQARRGPREAARSPDLWIRSHSIWRMQGNARSPSCYQPCKCQAWLSARSCDRGSLPFSSIKSQIMPLQRELQTRRSYPGMRTARRSPRISNETRQGESQPQRDSPTADTSQFKGPHGS
jgi:hypothetical protein